ncbi:MAG: hypothetical protein EOO45_26390 [Flavobacterium sp.]|nr:MAG: hypothetical protein EOO45_26390 [Flavobacterium sp.]
MEPYEESSTNFIYNLLFCDDINLFKERTKQPYEYPFDILFSEPASISGLQKIIDDENTDPRVKVLAYNAMIVNGHTPKRKELLGVIVEVGLENGLDVLASFSDGSARYINQSGKIIILEATDDNEANKITSDLFAASRNIVDQIGPWDQSRLPNPIKGNVRLTFLVSDGLYFGEAPIGVFFNDALAGPALAKATGLMQYIIQKASI